MTIKEKINIFRDKFNHLFENEIKNIIKEQYNFNPAITELDSSLTDIVMNYVRGGKRIRPFLIHFFADQDFNNDDVKTACIAIELFHLAALIHDDIMDESPLRRGVPTIHTAVQLFADNNSRLGEDIALLIGDVFLASSIAKAAALPKSIFEEFRLMIQRTIHGQYLDSFGMNQYIGNTPESEVLARHELKTAWYTFTSPALLGHMIAQKPQEEKEVLIPVMRELGLLFQIRDDIMDCTNTTSGKELFGDIFENQTTWVTLYVKNNFPKKFQEILVAKESKNVKVLETIFTDVDLHTPYEQEFQKRKNIIESIPDTYADIKSKAQDVLQLLVLK